MSVDELLYSKFEAIPSVLSGDSSPTLLDLDRLALTSKDYLCKHIIAALTIIDDDDTETWTRPIVLQRFLDVSEDDYDYVMSEIAETDKLICKPVYLPDLKCFLISELSSRVHSSFLPPMHMCICRAIESMPIKRSWPLIFPIHSSTKITVKGKTVGIPDLLLEIQGPAEDMPLWVLEVSSSETDEEVMSKMQLYAKRYKTVQVLTNIEVHESMPYDEPNNLSEAALMTAQDVVEFDDWQEALGNPASGAIEFSLKHPWVHPLIIMIKTWIRELYR
ncbi:uncharacterized protein F5891DRAFT_1190284 [Suillus fuscotomentosus]|uniref:Uncharacterized protein n=1 Tax=Suillus fuscotomentosus TaxID=1912939 RepID=A0AAD4E5E9_9AGAM|nr:uncharacterized protein F5891DRAFT_1190284 [Suillus fuscotomentosus]KAG1898804.1 hypothetical protein F5891DRAFT_1190284 [Suillus fuscotomentosus]